jgi:hypothetical protein
VERVSRTPHGTPRGSACPDALAVLNRCVVERLGAHRPFSRIPAPGLDAGSDAYSCHASRAGWTWLPLPRAWHSRANGRRSATPLQMTVCGHGDVSRPQETAPSSRCKRHFEGDRASIRVWCRHVSAAPLYGHEVTSPPRTPASSAQQSGPDFADGDMLPLDNRGPHKG